MAHRVAGRVEAFELDRLADLDDVAGLEAARHAGDLVLGVGVGQHLGAGRRDHLGIAADMVAVLVGVEDLGDGPALRLAAQAFLMIQRIDRQRLAGLAAGDEVVEIAPGIAVQICSTIIACPLGGSAGAEFREAAPAMPSCCERREVGFCRSACRARAPRAPYAVTPAFAGATKKDEVVLRSPAQICHAELKDTAAFRDPPARSTVATKTERAKFSSGRNRCGGNRDEAHRGRVAPVSRDRNRRPIRAISTDDAARCGGTRGS